MTTPLEVYCPECNTHWQDDPKRQVELCPKCGAKGVVDFKKWFADVYSVGVKEGSQNTEVFMERTEPKQHNTEISAVELSNYNFPETAAVIARDEAVLLEEKEKCIVSGYSKEGKSQLVITITLGMALGMNVLGFTLSKRKVLYLNGELTEKQFRKRLRQVASGLGIHLDDNFIVKTVRNYYLTAPENVQDLINSINKQGAQVLVIDTLSSVAPTDDSDQEGMKAHCATLDNIIDNTGVTIIEVHHQSKAGKDKRPALQTMRGSSYLSGWTDLNLTFVQQPNGKLPYIEVDVSGRGDPCPNLYFRRDNDSCLYTTITKAEAELLIPSTTLSSPLRQRMIAFINTNDGATKEALNDRYAHNRQELNYELNKRDDNGYFDKDDAGKYRYYDVHVHAANQHEQRKSDMDMDIHTIGKDVPEQASLCAKGNGGRTVEKI